MSSRYIGWIVLLVLCRACNSFCDSDGSENESDFDSCAKSVYLKDKFSVYIQEPLIMSFVKEYLESHSDEWELVQKTKEKPDLDLIYASEGIDIKSYNSHMFLSYWPLQNQFFNKGYFYKNAARLNASGKITELSLLDVMPLTYFFDLNQPKFTDEEKEFFRQHKTGVWIKKPVEEARCKGIEVFRDLKEFHLKVGKKKPFKKQQYPQDKLSWIVQKYIENSLLIEGKKFDIRSFVLVASFDPYVLLYHRGYIRRSLEKYSLDDLEDKMIHCVNQSVQMKHKHYEERKYDTIWSMERFEDWLIQNGQDPQIIEESILKRVAYSGLGQKDFVNQGKRSLHEKKFQLFGVDISFDDNFIPYIIEFNAHLSLQKYHIDSLNHIFKQVTEDMFRIEQKHIRYHETPYAYFESFEFIQDLGDFYLLYNEATNYSIIS